MGRCREKKVVGMVSMGVDPPHDQDEDDHEGAEEDEDLPAYRDEGQPFQRALEGMYVCHSINSMSLIYIIL
jgi:hypothetical protein